MPVLIILGSCCGRWCSCRRCCDLAVSAPLTRSSTSTTSSTCWAAPNGNLDRPQTVAPPAAPVLVARPAARGRAAIAPAPLRRLAGERRGAFGQAPPRRRPRVLARDHHARCCSPRRPARRVLWALQIVVDLLARRPTLVLWAWRAQRAGRARREGALHARAARARARAAPHRLVVAGAVDRARRSAPLGARARDDVRGEAPRPRGHHRARRARRSRRAPRRSARRTAASTTPPRSSRARRATIVAEADAALVGHPDVRTSGPLARRQEGARRGVVHAGAGARRPAADARGHRGRRRARTATASPKPRASCAASSSTGSAPASSPAPRS